MLAAHARVDGRQVYCYAQDASFAGGSLGEAHAETIVEVLRLAGRARVPVLGFVESAGARMQEGLAALSGYGAIFREHVRLSGLVPQISIVVRALGRRLLLRAGAERLRDHERHARRCS